MTNGNNVLLIWPDRDKGFYNFDPVGLITGQKTLFFPLPLIYVAAALGDGWNYTLADEGIKPLTSKEIANADFYMISVNTLQRYATDRLLERLTPQNKPIIIGGPLISTLDHIFSHPLVSKVYGEVEALESSHLTTGTTIAEVLSRDMKCGTLQKEYRATGHPDIKKNNYPRYDLVTKADYFSLSMQTSRGCPHYCDFCQQVVLFGKHRRKTNQQVIADLDSLLKISQNLSVILTDDNLMGEIDIPEKKQEFLELLDTIREWQVKHNYPFDFFTQCSLEIAQHEDVIEMMTKIGLNIMFIGIESVDNDSLSSVHKKQNLEQDMVMHIRTLQRYGMGIFAGIIIGFDNESDDTIAKQIDFIKKTHIPLVAPSLLHALPGTRMYKKLSNENRISRDLDALTKVFRTNIISVIDPRVLYNHLKRYLEEIYNPKEYFSRCIEWIKDWNDHYVIPGKQGSLPTNVRVKRILRSIFFQGIIANYRLEYYKYIIKSIVEFKNNYNKLALALYLGYMFRLAYSATKNSLRFIDNLPKEVIDEWNQYVHKLTDGPGKST
jgi:radical SAM superfamily enzyme YgiQ (UPF0313 family)